MTDAERKALLAEEAAKEENITTLISKGVRKAIAELAEEKKKGGKGPDGKGPANPPPDRAPENKGYLDQLSDFFGIT